MNGAAVPPPLAIVIKFTKEGELVMKTLSLPVLAFLLLLTVSPVHAGDEWILGTLRKEFNPQIAAANKKITLLENENLILRREIEELRLRITRLEGFHSRPAADKKQ
jgi:hypothetical protein